MSDSILVYPQNNTEYTAEDARSYLSTRGSGIYSSGEDFNVAGISSRNITIGSGLAWMRLEKFEGICVAVKSSQTVSVAAAGATARTDLIVLRYDQTQTPGVASIVCKTGSTSVQRDSGIYELGLYQVSVPANSNQILESHIKDVRMDATVCGLMTDGVNKLPTQSYFNQIQNQITEFGTSGNNAISSFNSRGNSAIATFNSNGNSAISTFTSSGQSSISSFNQKATNALNGLQDSVDEITAGSDVMLQTVFNQSRKTGQIAFESDVLCINTVYTPVTSSGKTDVIIFEFPFMMDENENDLSFLFEKIKQGKKIILRAFKLKYAGAKPTVAEERLGQQFAAGTIGLEQACDPKTSFDLYLSGTTPNGTDVLLKFFCYLNGSLRTLTIEGLTTSGKYQLV